jgi:hypothetical protein
MTDCTQTAFAFQGIGRRKVTADFSGGYLSSDGGGLLLREVEQRMGLVRRLAGCFVDGRDQRFVEHRLDCLIGQRLFGVALGYEDLIDHDRLRLDPLQAVLVGNEDVLGQKRTEATIATIAVCRCTVSVEAFRCGRNFATANATRAPGRLKH